MTETNKTLKEHAAAHIDVIATSSEKGRGVDELLRRNRPPCRLIFLSKKDCFSF